MPTDPRSTHAAPPDVPAPGAGSVGRRADPGDAAPWPAVWHAGPATVGPGVDQMALDLALLDLAATDGIATVRTYRWARPTVSFGRHEAVQRVWDVAGMQAAGWDVVRRPTGGRALLHMEVVTYAVAMPLPPGTPWRAAYAAVNDRLLRVLHRLGVPAIVLGTSPAPAPPGAACFTAPADGELLLHGAKLLGSAVWRARTAFLQHGSLLVHDRQGALEAFRLDGTAHAAPRSNAALADVLQTADGSALTEAAAEARVAESVATCWTDEAIPLHPLDPAHHIRVQQRVTGHRVQLSGPDWLWRR